MDRVPLTELLLLKDAGVWGDEDEADGTIVLRSTNLRSDGSIDFSKQARRAIPARKLAEKSLQEGDILLERSGGSPTQPVGRVAYFRGYQQTVVHGNFIGRLRPNPDLVEPRYLFRFLHRFHEVGGTLRYQSQTTGLRNLKFKEYERLEVPLLPLDEQRRIADLLDEADRLQRLRKEANEKAQRILPAMFIAMFGDPSGWRASSRSVPMRELACLSGGKTPSKARADYWNGTVPWVSPKDMKTEAIHDSEDHLTDLAVREAGMASVPRSAVLVVVRGMILARRVPVGLTAAEVTINQDMKALVPRDGTVTGEYIYGALSVGNEVLMQEIGTAGHGTKKLDTAALMDFRVPLPSEREVARVTEVTTQALAVIAKTQKSAQALEQATRVLRSKLFAQAN